MFVMPAESCCVVAESLYAHEFRELYQDRKDHAVFFHLFFGVHLFVVLGLYALDVAVFRHFYPLVHSFEHERVCL